MSLRGDCVPPCYCTALPTLCAGTGDKGERKEKKAAMEVCVHTNHIYTQDTITTGAIFFSSFDAKQRWETKSNM